MKYHYLENRDLKEAIAGYREFLMPQLKKSETETISVVDSLGRITAVAGFAKISSPHYNACAMDGIAVRAKDTFEASELSEVTLTADNFVQVDTGDVVPEGFDAVVMIEEVVFNGSDVVLRNSAHAWQNIRQIGEDLCQGDMILPSYTKLSPAAIGAFLAGGITQIEVFKKVRIGVIPTGDELIPVGEQAESGKIIEFNSHMIKATLTEASCDVTTYDIVKDKPELLKESLLKALGENDIVLINAGSSAGRDDYTKKAIEETGSVFCHGIAIKPGKPCILGVCGSVPVIGLPGYPVSAAIVLEQVVLPVIEIFSKNTPIPRNTARATISRKIVSSLKYQEFIRMKLGYISEKLVASPISRGAGAIASFAKADGITEISYDSEGLNPGDEVDVVLLKPIEEIKNALIVTGSHDPMLDMLGDIMRRNTSFFLSSTHVGSFGGIMALLRGETHIAPIHLLDIETGEYNKSYVEKYFKGDIVLVKGVRRTQGIMVKKGNPKGITAISDIAKAGVRYINRQKWAGTRVLFDFMLQKFEISQSNISGYENEEYTHTAVAAQIAGDNADAGLGIYAAAKNFDLDFVPVANEDYDFLIKTDMQNDPLVKAFLEVLHSDTLKNNLKDIGGYEIYDR